MAAKKVNNLAALQALENQGLRQAEVKLAKKVRGLSLEEEGSVEMSKGNVRRKARWFDQ